MRLTAIELENFKGISQRQRIEFRPITLLFGPNSAGKSTVLQALHYVREILERQNVDPDVTIAGGLLNLGNFATIVHQHDLRRPVVIKLEVALEFGRSYEELPLNSGAYLSDSAFSELQIRYLIGEVSHVAGEFEFSNQGHHVVTDYGGVQTAAIRLEVTWSNLHNAPYVARLDVELDGQPVASIYSPPERGRAQLTEINFSHPLLREFDPLEDDIPQSQSETGETNPLQFQMILLSREAAVSQKEEMGDPDHIYQRSAAFMIKPRVNVRTIFGALPKLDQDLIFDLRDPDVKQVELETTTPRVLGLNRLLSELVLGPPRIVCNCLKKMRYIGPLREIPSRGYLAQISPDEGRWAHGLAAWDRLYSNKGTELIQAVNTWLADPTRLKAGYRLEPVQFREIEIPGLFALKFQQGLSEDDLSELQQMYAELPIRHEIILREERSGVIVGPNDVGVGLSQLIPVIVSTLDLDQGLLCIEQPELHIHPAIQVGLGDLFAAVVQDEKQPFYSDRTLLIETHSEHIMLRLLRRIRETSDGELPPGAPRLTPSDVAVIYVETDTAGVHFKSVRVSSDGDFIDRWPHGFFEEREEELF
jgi:predicted ATPase